MCRSTSGTSSGATNVISPVAGKIIKREFKRELKVKREVKREVKRDLLTLSANMLFNADDEKPWSCKVCNRKYKWKNSLNCHIKNECGKPPKFFCERMCGYKTNIHSNMKRHMNSNCKPRFLQ